MKKLLIAIFSLVVVLSFSGCDLLGVSHDLTVSNGTGGTIGDATITDFPLVVTETGSINGVYSVTIKGLTHTYASDLVFTIVTPGGTAYAIRNFSGSGNDFSGDYTFSWGGAANFAYTGSVVTPGNYKTTYDLSTDISSGSVSGTWYLRITDRNIGDTGSLTSWGMTLKYRS